MDTGKSGKSNTLDLDSYNRSTPFLLVGPVIPFLSVFFPSLTPNVPSSLKFCDYSNLL